MLEPEATAVDDPLLDEQDVAPVGESSRRGRGGPPSVVARPHRAADHPPAEPLAELAVADRTDRPVPHRADPGRRRDVRRAQVVHLDLVFSNNTPTGGDMGAHVMGPAYLRDELLPNGQLSGWSMYWYAGFPMYRFYMVVPALMIVGLNVLCSRTAIAFKIVAVARARHAAVLLLGVRPAGPVPLPDPRADRARRDALPVRRELLDLRRQREEHDGGGVLLLHRPVARHARPRPVRPRPADRQVPQLGGDRARPGDRSATASWRSSSSLGAVLLWLVCMDKTRFKYGLECWPGRRCCSAFWIVPFLFNHQYMTDMKYGFRPDGADGLVLEDVLPVPAVLGHRRQRRWPSSASSGDRPPPARRRRGSACCASR